jgi:hypothetical protein
MASTMLQPSKDADTISYLSQAEATAIDEVLMGELGFSIDQLMVKSQTHISAMSCFSGTFVTCIRASE